MAASVQDGCYAWAVCAATFLVLVIQGGLVYSMGVFYIMFQQGLDAGDSALSLVTSLNYSTLYLVCPFVGILTEKYGERPLAIIGAFMATTGLACCSFATEPYHLYLGYSLVTGVGFGMVYNPCISILGKYFNRYIKVASGMAVCGNGIGAFIFPPILKSLEDKYGWRGALLLVSGIYAHIMVFGCLYRPLTTKNITAKNTADDKECGETGGCSNSHNALQHKQGEEGVEEKLMQLDESHIQNGLVEDNSHLRNRKKMEANSNHSLKGSSATSMELHSQSVLKRVILLFKSVPFTCLCLHSMLNLFPTVLVYTHLGSYILTLGFTKRDVVLLYMAIGITTTITRLLLGALAEFTRANPTYLVMVSALIDGILTILLPFTDNLILIYVYGVLFSIMVSPYNAFCFPMTVDSVHKSQTATGYGVVCFFCVPGTAFGAPLAAWLYDYTNLYASSFYLAGALFILSGLIMIPALWQAHKKQSSQNLSSSQRDKPETKGESVC